MKIFNQEGNTLIENVVALFILAILSALVGTILLSTISLYEQSNEDYMNFNHAYNDIQCNNQESRYVSTKQGSISFKYNGRQIKVDGEYIYDKQTKSMFEFIKE